MDLAKAYDSVDQHLLLEILKKRMSKRLKEKGILNLISQMLCDTRLYLEISDEDPLSRLPPERKGIISTTRGLPQGSSLSPLLFAIYLDDVMREVYTEHQL